MDFTCAACGKELTTAQVVERGGGGQVPECSEYKCAGPFDIIAESVTPSAPADETPVEDEVEAPA